MGGTSVKAHPVAAIPDETQGIAQAGRLPTEGCEATRPVNKAATRTISFIVSQVERTETMKCSGIREIPKLSRDRGRERSWMTVTGIN